MTTIKIAIFLLLSALLLTFTVRRRHRHRFYRFVAFESLLGLVLVNADMWFQDPFSGLQIISWIFLAGSLLLAIHGFRLLYQKGAPDQDLEETTQLVRTGAYRYVRHPLYCSLLLMGAGAFLKHPSGLGFGIFLLLCISSYATGRAEEVDNLEKWGAAYREYQEETKMFIPFLI